MGDSRGPKIAGSSERILIPGTGIELPRCNKDPNRNRQVERGSVFPHVGWCKVDRDATRRNLKAGIDERSAHALPTLLDRARGESDDRPLRKAGGDIDLDDDLKGVDPNQRGGTHSGKHSLWYWADTPQREHVLSPAVSPSRTAFSTQLSGRVWNEASR